MSETTDGQLAILFGRRSVRIYTPAEITKEQVTRMLEAAMAAPSAMTKDPWRFVTVRDPATLGELAAALPGGKMLPTASMAIVVCGDQEAAFEQHLSFLLQDCSAAIENLLLCAHGLGLGACWVGVHPLEDSCRKLKQLLALPASFLAVAVIALGHPGEHLPPRTRYNQAYIRAEKWSAA